MRSRWENIAARARRSTMVVAGVLAAAVALGVIVWQASGLPDDAALSVGGEVVSQADLRREVATLKAMYGVAPPSDAADREGFWRDVARATAMSEILDRAAEAEGVDVSPRQVDEAVASYVDSLYEGTDDAQGRFVQALTTAGTSRRAVETEVHRRLTVDKLRAGVIDTVATPGADVVRREFDERGCTLEVPERRELRNIVVASRSEADRVRSDLDGGAEFESLARTRSADGATSESGGSLGAVVREQLEEDYAEAAFGADPGDVFGPVRTESGWNVGQVEKVIEKTRTTYERVATLLGQQIVLERESAAWRSWLQDRLDESGVVYAPTYRPEDPGSLPPTIAPSPTDSGRCTPATTEGQNP